MERIAQGQEHTEHHTPSVEEQSPTPSHDASKFSGRGSIPSVHEHHHGATAQDRTASEQAFDGDLPAQIDAHISKTRGGVEIKTDAVPALAGGIWMGRGDNLTPSRTGVVDKSGRVTVTLPAPPARSLASMDILIQSPDRKVSYRLNCGLEPLATGDEQTGETVITRPTRQLLRSAGPISPYELTIADGAAFTNQDLDHAGVAVTPKPHLEGISDIRDGRGHVRIPGARVARGTGRASVVNVTTGATITGGFLQPDGSFELDFPLEDNARYAVQVQFEGVRYMGASFHTTDGTNPLLLLKL